MKINFTGILAGMLMLAFTITSACSSKQQEDEKSGITISGSVKYNDAESNIIIYQIDQSGGRIALDTISTDTDGNFSESIAITELGFYMINFFNKQENYLVLSPKDLTVNITADGSDPQGIFEVEGSAETNALIEIQNIEEKIGRLSRDASEKLTALQSTGIDEATFKDSIAIYKEAFEKKANQLRIEFIEKKPDFIASMILTQQMNPDENFAYMESVADGLSAKYPDKPALVKSFVEMVDKLKATSIGSIAPDITLNDPQGNEIKLSSLRGKLVLIDFWASWCGPCRKENPNVVKMYDKYKNKGFEIYGVSLDKDKSKWEQAIEQDNLGWIHVSDLNAWQSEAARLYGINAIPNTFLIDSEGKIIAKNLRGKALEDKLAEIL